GAARRAHWRGHARANPRRAGGGHGMSALSGEEVRAADPAGMIDDVLAQPDQLGDALWRVQSAGLRKRDMPGGLVVCGMGGSAIGGDLAAAALGDRATRPIRTIRGYG